ncbi:hypothetical protein DPMN_112691 [Dreissena polymorpha]|uniref:Uncharacterized protein n=1 Tax=Dreissena polymorpha TaxID=45954 RepID=A0A9D4QR51_DREPO|nr:hypothetical protein DPMN_112691 [Dreissena polymorpha]
MHIWRHPLKPLTYPGNHLCRHLRKHNDLLQLLPKLPVRAMLCNVRRVPPCQHQ